VNRRPPKPRAGRGFTLIEVLVALAVVAIGLAALMTAVSGTARTSGYLRDKTLAEWMALNRLAEVRLNLNKFGQNTDTGELRFANRTWHYDTRYFDTSITSMQRVVVRVYAGDAKTQGNALAEAVGFTSNVISLPGSSNTADWNPPPIPPGSGGPVAPGGPAVNPAAPALPIAPNGGGQNPTTPGPAPAPTPAPTPNP